MVQDMDGADPTGMARNTPSGGTPGIAPGTVVLITHDDVLWFETPREIHACDRVEDVSATLAAIETAARGGSHLAGYLAYEAGRAFEPKLAALPGPEPGNGLPLVWFGTYDAPRRMTPDEALDRLVGDTPQASIAVEGFDMDARAHEAAFERVRDHLACGDIYQANLTMRARGTWSGNPGALFARLLRGQPVGHAALLRLDRHWVLSLSPELFLEREGERLRTRPMKGTLARGRDAREDDALAASLALDPKSRAENVMIVDLLRNDLSRVAEPGSVQVPRLFEVESYATLFQMTSTVEARLVPDTGFAAIVFVVAVYLMQVRRLVGPGVMTRLLLGRYAKPVREERIYLLVDLKGSTAMAERLGDEAAHAFIARVFFDLDRPVTAHGGRIEGYVGDELIAAWKPEAGLRDSAVLQAYAGILEVLRRNELAYRRSFGEAAGVRASLHIGPVVTGECGDSRLVILSIGRDKLSLRYETWRLLHGIGALAVAGLVYLHAVEAGRYSQDAMLRWFWSGLLGLAVLSLLVVYVVKPLLQLRRGWQVSAVRQVAGAPS